MSRTEPYEKDDSGNWIDPPVIAEYEDKLRHAQTTGDTDAIAAVTEDYDKARNDLIERTNQRLREADSDIEVNEVSDAGDSALGARRDTDPAAGNAPGVDPTANADDNTPTDSNREPQP